MATLYSVALRHGKKGPGKQVAMVASQADADSIKAMLTTDNSDTEVVISERPETVVETPTEFKNRWAIEQAAEGKRAAALAKLTPAEREALGLKA